MESGAFLVQVSHILQILHQLMFFFNTVVLSYSIAAYITKLELGDFAMSVTGPLLILAV